MDYKALNGICEEYAQKAVEWRRDLHRHPEPAWTEFRTTAFLAKTLEEAGVPVLMGKQVVCPEYAMGYPEESVIKAAMERAVEQGADPAYVQRTQGYTGLCAVIDTGREGPVVAIRMDIDSNDVEVNDGSLQIQLSSNNINSQQTLIAQQFELKNRLEQIENTEVSVEVNTENQEEKNDAEQQSRGLFDLYDYYKKD